MNDISEKSSAPKGGKSILSAQTPLKILLEALAILAVLLLVGVVLFVWRVNSAPLDIGFAKPYVQDALSSEEDGRYVRLGNAQLHWPKLTGPLLMGVDNFELLDQNQKIVMSVDEVAIGLRKRWLIFGQVAPSVLIIKEPVLHVIRNRQGGFDFGIEGPPAPPVQQAPEEKQGEEQNALVEIILSYIAQPGLQSIKGSPLASLEAFKIEGAKLMVEDHMIGVSWFLPRFDAFLQSGRKGLEAEVYLDLPGGREDEAYIQGRVDFDSKSRHTSAQLEIKNFDTNMVAGKFPELAMLRGQDIVFDARMDMQVDKDLKPIAANMNVAATAGSFQYEGVYSDPVPFNNLVFNAVYDQGSKTLALSEATVTVNDVTIKAAGNLTHDEAMSAIEGPLSVRIDEVAQSKIAPLWPEVLEGDNSEKWIVKRLSNGTFYNASADVVLVGQKGEDGWSFDADDIKAAFDFDGMTVDYNSPMVPVTEGKGRGTFDNLQEKITIHIDSAKLGGLNVTKGDLEFVEIIAKGKGVADINVALNGPLVDVINYVSKEPIALNHDFPLDQVRGDADMVVNVVFPAVDDIKIEDVKVNVTGKANNVNLPGVVGDLALGGGPYDVSIKDNLLNVSGSGTLEGQAVTATYQTYLESEGKPFKTKIIAKTTATEDMRNKMGIDLSEFMRGPAGVDVTYTEQRDGRALADIKVDITPSTFFVSPLDFEKAPGIKGEATLQAALQNDALQKITGLTASAPKFSLEGGEVAFRQVNGKEELSYGKAARFVVDESIGNIEFEVSPAGQAKIVVAGQVLDLRPFISSNDDNGEQPYDAPPMVVSVAVDKMITHQGEAVQYGKLYADIDGQGRFNQMEMDAIAGKGDVYLRYKPDATGMRVFRFEADDAGATLKAFGVYDKIIGGKMVIYGEPIKGVFDRNLLGRAEITDFKVIKAPGLAQLLSAMSLPGLMSTLDGEGLNFAKLESNFDWLYRPGGSLLVLKDGRTSGNSLGLTFDGTFDNARGYVDVSGTLVPLSGINDVIGSIPVLGDILTGGSGGVFAATYKMKGQGKDTEISVNPLSVLAPGIIRRILFEQN